MRVQSDIQNNNAADYTPSSFSAELKNFWELRKQAFALRPANRPKATRSAFTTEQVTYDGEEPPPETAAATKTAASGSQEKGKKKKNKKKSTKGKQSTSR